MAEIVFILEPDAGRVTVESSQADAQTAKEINKDLGQGTNLNCARPKPETQSSKSRENSAGKTAVNSRTEQIYLYRIYHHSTVDGPGRRSVIQLAGCSIRCPGCYVPETHERESGQKTSIEEIVAAIDKKSGEHDGVTILGGEPFDQPESLEILVEKLKAKGFHLTIYSGFRLDDLLARKCESVNRILAKTDLLIDGAFRRELAKNAGEYRGSSNQRLIFHPISRMKTQNEKTNLPANDIGKIGQSKADYYEFIETCLDEGWCPTRCPKGCIVEPDGVCPHNFKSVALKYGII